MRLQFICLAIMAAGIYGDNRILITPSYPTTFPLSVTQNTSQVFTVRLTNAIVCPVSPNECSVIVLLNTTSDDANLINVEPCFLKFTQGKFSQEQYFTVSAVPNLATKNNLQQVNKATVVPVVDTLSEYYAVSTLNKINAVTVPPVHSSGQCNSVGDPHYTTFDGKYWHYYDGTTINPSRLNMVVSTNPKRLYGQLVIQAQMAQGSRPARNCALAGREGNNLVIVSFCGGSLELIKRFDPNGDVNVQPIVSVSGQSYTVLFKSGAWFRYDSSSAYGGVYISVPGSDYNYVCGACGNFNSNPNDDVASYVVNYNYELFHCQRTTSNDPQGGADDLKFSTGRESPNSPANRNNH